MRVRDLQVYRKMDVTRERISCILKLSGIHLSFQAGFNLVSAAVCAILQSISGLKPSSVITEPRYLKLVTVSSFCPFCCCYLCVGVTGGVYQLGLLSADLHAVGC